MNNWFIYNKKQNIEEISKKYGINQLTSIILCNRNIKTEEEIKKILSSDINDINDEKLLPDIDKACEIINDKIKNKKTIRIVGDYDIDGVCATYILYDALTNLGAKVTYDIPDRINDGYGININIIDKAILDKVDTIITCDNGIAAGKQIEYAKNHNITIIVTDHHDIGELPKYADAIINPKRTDVKNNYPFAEICGAVVAWKLIIRFYELYGKEYDVKYDRNFAIDNYLEFAMLATIGDIMPLINENHIIAKLGLRKILNTNNKGLKKLIEVSGLNTTKGIETNHIGFIIGPLINVAGRMDKATTALKLFLSNDDYEIISIANRLKSFNDERKAMTENGTEEAIKKIEREYINDKILVIHIENLGEQVAGIVAGRIKEKYNKPTIILTATSNEEELKASCRSIEAYDIFEALNIHKEMFTKFGGHKLAAGFSILKEKVDELRKYLNNETTLDEKDFIKKEHIDAEYLLTEMNENIINDIAKLEPYGQRFNSPVFATKDVKVSILNIYGVKKNVIQLLLEKNAKNGKGVIFTDSELFKNRLKKGKNFDLLYYPRINEYNGYKNIEINIIDYK